jgi:hypothetical protein
MKITVVRSGGFTGISMPPKVLETEDAELQALALETVATASIETERGLDMMQYTITIENGNDGHKLLFMDRLLPEKAQKLVDYVIDNGK